ncbi:hypothetical protein B0H13DRAFT_1886174 [Mycena leptocephala]|nr:hypothetical protein B0H13DRAFT_1886174 [Mycena leptocephala]
MRNNFVVFGLAFLASAVGIRASCVFVGVPPVVNCVTLCEACCSAAPDDVACGGDLGIEPCVEICLLSAEFSGSKRSNRSVSPASSSKTLESSDRMTKMVHLNQVELLI